MCGGGDWNSGTSGMDLRSSCTLILDDLTQQTWKDLPSNIAFHAMTTLNNPDKSILLTGGIETPTTQTAFANATTTAWLLRQPGKDSTWEQLPDMQFARAAHRIVATNDGGAIVFGGSNRMGPGYPADFTSVECAEVFDLDTLSFTPIDTCIAAGAGPDPVFALHPNHEMLLFGNRTLSNGDGAIGSIPVNAN